MHGTPPRATRDTGSRLSRFALALRACAWPHARKVHTFPAALRTHLHVLGFPSESACALRALPPRRGATRTPPCAPLKLARAPLRRHEPHQLPIAPSLLPLRPSRYLPVHRLSFGRLSPTVNNIGSSSINS